MPSLQGADQVTAIKAAGEITYLGGAFSELVQTNAGVLQSIPRKNLAAVQTKTGRIMDWSPTTDGLVNDFAFYQDTVFVAGAFQNVSGQRRLALAAVDAKTGHVKDWNAQVEGSSIETLAAVGQKLFLLGGNFTHVEGVPRTNLAAVDIRSGHVLNWTPQGAIGNQGAISSLAVGNGNIFVGSYYDPGKKEEIWKIDQESGLVTTFTPFRPPNSNPNLIIFETKALLIEGDKLFGHVRAISNWDLAGWIYCYDLNQHSVLWSFRLGVGTAPDATHDQAVYSFALKDDRLYAGGSFNAGGSFRLAAFDAMKGVLLSGITVFPSSGTIGKIATSGDNLIVAGQSLREADADFTLPPTSLLWLAPFRYASVDLEVQKPDSRVTVRGNHGEKSVLEMSTNLTTWNAVASGVGAFTYTNNLRQNPHLFFRASFLQ